MLIRPMFRNASTAVLVAAALAGCGAMRPSEKIDIYEASLTGSQEVPPVTTAGTGMAEVLPNNRPEDTCFGIWSTVEAVKMLRVPSALSSGRT